MQICSDDDVGLKAGIETNLQIWANSQLFENLQGF
jgi:hypothetical protein